MHKNSW